MQTISKIADKMLGQKETSTPAQPLFDETRTMNALIYNAKKDIRYVEKPRPLITDQRDVVVKVTATTICGSDLHLFTGAMLDMHQGDILGHEFMGIVEDVGSEVKTIRQGQRVVVAFDIACGYCEYCQKEQYTACDTTNPSKLVESMYGHRTAALFGYSHLTGGVPGGQAEYVRVPFADVNCLVLPPNLPDVKVLYLSDVVPTAYHGTELAKVKEGDVVGIWGLGPIGLMAARWCQFKKARVIIGIDCIEERINVAKKLGITVLNFKEVDICKTIAEIVPGGLDSGIECAGFEYATTMKHKIERALNLETDSADILTEMITAVKKFGTVSIIGVYSGFANHFPIGAMMEKDLIVNGGQSPTQKYWKFCLEKIQSGEIDPTFIVSNKARLSDGPKLYELFYNKAEGVMKVFLRPDNYDPEEPIILQ